VLQHVLAGVAADELAATVEAVDLTAPVTVDDRVEHAARRRVRHDRIIRRWSDNCGPAGRPVGAARLARPARPPNRTFG
jgi:hypothetical protein